MPAIIYINAWDEPHEMLYVSPHVEEMLGYPAARWLERGVIVAPGSFFGPAGEGYLRLALVPPLEAIERAIDLMRAP